MGIPSTDFEIYTYSSQSSESSDPGSTESSPTSGISLKLNSSWTHCGPFLDLTSLPPSFHTWANATVKGDLIPRLVPFLSFLHAFLVKAQIDHYWLTIRASQATHDFDVPRWHTDRNYFDRAEQCELHWKLATTLVGPGTLFLSDGGKARAIQKKTRHSMKKTIMASHQCRAVRCLGCADMQQVIRKHLAEKLANYEIVQPGVGDCSFFRVGDEKGAMHSEPPIPGDRVFVNVVPGCELELRKLMATWGMSFPRSWSLGVPLNLD